MMQTRLRSDAGGGRTSKRLRCSIEMLERRVLLSAMTFQINTQSTINLTGNVSGDFPFQEQAPGSLSTPFSGTINAEVENGSISFTEGSQIKANNNGAWQPGNAPANYGAFVDGQFLGTANAAVRSLAFGLGSSGLVIAPDGTFDAASLTFNATSGTLESDGFIPEANMLAGQSAQDQLSSGQFTMSGSTATLTIPVQLMLTFSGLSADDSELDFDGSITATAQVTAQPTLQSIQPNNGAPQRSEVRSATLVFDHPVMLGTGAVTLASTSGGTSADASAALGMPTTNDGGITWMIPFVPGTTYTDATGSLIDGNYSLTVHAADVTDSAGNTLNGGDQTLGFHRLFGDINGDGVVNNTDFFKFKSTFGHSTGDPAFIPAFDYNADGVINNTDFFQFKKRFGTRV